MDDLERALTTAWPYVASALAMFSALVASVHVILHKRDVRAAAGWLGLIWFVPVLGAAAYIVLGINRIRRRGALLRSAALRHMAPSAVRKHDPEWIRAILEPGSAHLDNLARLVDSIARRPIVYGNRVVPLRNGDAAYPEMLAAIDRARHGIALATFIFDNDPVGQRFAEALGRAVSRGVAVRVLVDAVGARYAWPTVFGILQAEGVRWAQFLPTLLPWRMPYLNLRNHRKILVVDGRLGFTGGMNLREGHLLGAGPVYPVQDLHFRLEGPVVRHLMEVFTEDWLFATREALPARPWFPPLERAGPVAARGLSDGPDEDHNKLRWTLLGALACARRTVRIVTPYFLPDVELVSALNVAALRGVQVDIVLPEENNLRLVKWASTARLWQVLEHGCRVYLTPPPFDHSKLMVVDGAWSLIGSGNWDPRSLRLNFEFNVECYDPRLATELEGLIYQKLRDARELTLLEVDARPFPVKLRDGATRLLMPYL